MVLGGAARHGAARAHPAAPQRASSHRIALHRNSLRTNAHTHARTLSARCGAAGCIAARYGVVRRGAVQRGARAASRRTAPQRTARHRTAGHHTCGMVRFGGVRRGALRPGPRSWFRFPVCLGVLCLGPWCAGACTVAVGSAARARVPGRLAPGVLVPEQHGPSAGFCFGYGFGFPFSTASRSQTQGVRPPASSHLYSCSLVTVFGANGPSASPQCQESVRTAEKNTKSKKAGTGRLELTLCLSRIERSTAEPKGSVVNTCRPREATFEKSSLAGFGCDARSFPGDREDCCVGRTWRGRAVSGDRVALGTRSCLFSTKYVITGIFSKIQMTGVPGGLVGPRDQFREINSHRVHILVGTLSCINAIA